jgi:hypothetical protein
MRKSRNKTGYRALRAGVAVAATATVVVAGTALPASAAAITLGTTQVAAAGGSTLYFYAPTAATLNNIYVRFQAPSTAACPTLYTNTSATSGAETPVNGGAITGVTHANGADTGKVGWITTPALTAGTDYKTCLYIDATSGGPISADTLSSPTVSAVHFGNLSATSGAANSRVTLTSSSVSLSTTASFTTQFVSGVTSCPTTFLTPDSTHINATTTRTSATVATITVPTLTAGTPYFVCTYSGTTNASSPLVMRGSTTFTTNSATLPVGSITPTGGSSGVATNITLSMPATSPVFTGAAPQVLVTRNSCPSTRPATGTPASTSALDTFAAPTTKISTTKLAVTVPTPVLVGSGDVTTSWNLCTYATNTAASALLAAPITYNAAPVLSLASAKFTIGSSAAATTASGPAAGGSTITVTDLSGLPTQAQVDAGATLSANLGGSPINITAINDSTSFTGVTTAHAPGDVRLAVTTAAGTATDTSADYTYTYGITVTPNTAASGSTPVIDIMGAGFSNIGTWGSTATTVAAAASTGYVLLTDNTYNELSFSNLNMYANAPVSYCNNVLPISDTELICTLNLTAMIDSVATGATPGTTDNPVITTVDVPAGTYTIKVLNDGLDIDAGEYSVVSSGAAFTVSPF